MDISKYGKYRDTKLLLHIALRCSREIKRMRKVL
jgi:hypothetical protein